MLIRRALISVYDKTNVLELSRFLLNKNISIVSTGGTFNLLNTALSNYQHLITEVSDVTKFPEILGGRVKSLHPSIHGAILAKRNNDEHMSTLDHHGIDCIDLVVTNLYPFESVVKKNPNNEDMILENIDIGGHTLIRAAAKNYKDVVVLTDISDYQLFVDNWDNISENLRKSLAAKAYHYVTRYDMSISGFFNKEDKLYNSYSKKINLKYGLNPQQKNAAIFSNDNNNNFPFTVLNGNPGYINFLDATYSWNLVCELSKTINIVAVASFKHNSPAGVAIPTELSNDDRRTYFIPDDKKLSEMATAFIRARNTDPLSSFGDFIAISGIVDDCTAELIRSEVSDGIIAFGYSEKALNILKSKKSGNYVILKGEYIVNSTPNLEIRDMHGLTFVQDENKQVTEYASLNNVVTSNNKIPDANKLDLIIGNTTLKYTQSNSVCAVKLGQVLGVGAGQQSRIDCVKLVKRKVENWYLRRHPKVLNIHKLFKAGVSKTEKTNAIIEYIENYTDHDDFRKKFDTIPEKLTDDERREFIKTLSDVSMASDAFLPFTDNIDIAKQFGTKYIVQPGGSVADNDIITACNNNNISMAFTGSNMRMFLH